ncbi:MAG TPA: hypothetical protein VG248_15510 [Caulobacteraceae bacterium]|jgi:hypothetical protein|nr:hypothetical protein [Caulobacteraceae bacterium]
MVASSDANVARVAGLLIASASLLSIIVILHHPSVQLSDAAHLIEQVRASAGLDRWVHGVLAVMFTALALAMVSLATAMGFGRASVLVGLAAYGLFCIFLCQAIELDGFVTPRLAERCPSSLEACAAQLQPLFLLVSVQIETATRFALFAIALGIASFSLGLTAHGTWGKSLGGLGMASAAAQLWLLFMAHSRLTPLSLVGLLAPQVVWHLAIAASMLGGLGVFGDPRSRVARQVAAA